MTTTLVISIPFILILQLSSHFLLLNIIKLVLEILRKVYLPETKDLLSLSNSNDIVSHTSFESSPTRNKLVSPANNYRFHYRRDINITHVIGIYI